jgi:putative polyhydroxyalkanoate system protein
MTGRITTSRKLSSEGRPAIRRHGDTAFAIRPQDRYDDSSCATRVSRTLYSSPGLSFAGRTGPPSTSGIVMPQFQVVVPHALSQEEARARLNRFVDILRAKFQESVSDLAQNWDGDTLRFSFKTFGIALKGGVTVGDKALDVKGELPFTALMFRGKIESSIREQLERLMRGDGK